MEEKVPCIRCNRRIWRYIEPYLREWNYKIEDIYNWSVFSLLIINRNNILGEVTNIKGFPEDEECRFIVKNVDEFLTKAAELMGYTYTDSYKDGVVKLTIEQIEDILDIPRGLLIIDE